MNNDDIQTQQAVCARVGCEYTPTRPDHKLGISAELLSRAWQYPLNGLRLPPEPGTTGWFVWTGTEPLSQAPDYFQPLHVEHLGETCPELVPYLGLPPGWRFLLAPGHEDLWFDETILDDDAAK